MINRPVREDIPIYIASMGPRNVQLTAEVADGWLPSMYDPAKAADVWGDDLAIGAKLRHPSRAPLEIVAPALVAVCDDPDEAATLRDLARPMTALYVGGMGAKGRNYYNDIFARFGYDREAANIQDLYLAGRKDEAAAAVPAEFLAATTLIGDVGYLRDRIAAYHEAGVTRLNITPVGRNRLAVIEQLKAASQ